MATKLIFKLAKPSEEPFGITKYRWATWRMMSAVHQSRRRAVFDKFNPLEGRRFF